MCDANVELNQSTIIIKRIARGYKNYRLTQRSRFWIVIDIVVVRFVVVSFEVRIRKQLQTRNADARSPPGLRTAGRFDIGAQLQLNIANGVEGATAVGGVFDRIFSQLGEGDTPTSDVTVADVRHTKQFAVLEGGDGGVTRVRKGLGRGL